MIRITECPRDAIQGFSRPISSAEKLAYYELLTRTGFDTLDVGSFVSPKAIPQMADTAFVLSQLTKTAATQWLVIVANVRGAAEACAVQNVDLLGFPFSLSPTFQQRNTNAGQEESFALVEQMQLLCKTHGKTLVVYLSMAFGNPYGDAYSPQLIGQWASRFAAAGITHISLADTVGLATPGQIFEATEHLLKTYPQITTHVHLHCTAYNWQEKLKAAVDAGCMHIDAAMGGAGGCPMAQDELVGNLATENLVQYLQQNQIAHTPLNMQAFAEAEAMAHTLFAAR